VPPRQNLKLLDGWSVNMRVPGCNYMRALITTTGLFAILMFAASPVIAAEILVPGHFATIAEAVAAASANDVIKVGPGRYREPPIELTIPLVFRSEAGPYNTSWDAQSLTRILLVRVDTEIEGFSFGGTSAPMPDPGGSVSILGGNVVFKNCLFSFHHGRDGGALSVSAANLMMTDCYFLQNYSPLNGSAIDVTAGADVSVSRCHFKGNSRAIEVRGSSSVHVSESLFEWNGPAIHVAQSTGTVQTSTFYWNSSGDEQTGVVTIDDSPGVTVERNIINGNGSAGYGLSFSGGEGSHGCNVFWANTAGAIAGGMLASDEVVGDPLMCNPGSGTFTLFESSPATPTNSACGLLIGAFGVGCTVPVETMNWGRVKSLYGPKQVE
jgi:hypothetical protein